MNIVDIIILAVLAYGLFAGMYKGMLASGLKLFGFAGAWYGARTLYERVAHFALSNRTLMAVLNQYLEPETFFSDQSIASSNVAQVIAGNESSIQQAVSSVGEKFSFLTTAFSDNLRKLAFENLGLNTVSEYFNQTLWVAVFNVLAFILAFIVLYLLISLVINLLDRVISFPLLRRFDWFVGGVFGLLRSTVVIVLLLNVIPVVLSMVNPELTQKILSESQLYSFCSQFDLLNVNSWIQQLIMG
ncbi:MAG: CvpA family protein [Clostridia bacterium]|nr:CvpA family protein [Clostridia bacterium]